MAFGSRRMGHGISRAMFQAARDSQRRKQREQDRDGAEARRPRRRRRRGGRGTPRQDG